MSEELTSVIEDAISDVELPEDPIQDPTPTDPVEVAPEPPSEVVEPSQTTTEPKVDDFDKRYGLAQNGTSGRENRIPYSRVRKITDNAVKEALAAKEKEYTSNFVPTTKYSELEAKVKDYEPKIQDYEDRLVKVAEFERIMLNDTPRFIGMLAGLPQYQQLLAPLFQDPAARVSQSSESDPSDMPMPDVKLADGSTVYSLEGLRKRDEWNRALAKKESLAEFETRIKEVVARYEPLEKDFQRHVAVQQVLPKVRQQVEEARKWPMFNENEDDIAKVLGANPSYTLERAYQTVVWPKMQVSRDKMRTEILQEIKSAPRATSAPATGFKPAPVSGSGPKTLEEIIAEQVRGLK